MAVQTGKLVVIGSYSSSMYPSVCVEAVEKLGKSTMYTHCQSLRIGLVMGVSL